MSWLAFAESYNMRRSHISDDIYEYDKHREGLMKLFGRNKFQYSFVGSLARYISPALKLFLIMRRA